MMNLKKKLALVVTGVMVFSVFTGCKKEENALTPVRLSEVVHSVFYAPQYVAQELGFFRDQGIEVSVSVGQGADKSMTALLSDSADIALLGTEAGIYVYNEGKEDYPKAFAQLTQRAGNFLVSREAQPNFKWTDLTGKSVIGGRIGGMPELVLEYIIKKNGMEIGKDMEIINNIAFTSTSGAFVGDVGDYTVEFEPTATTLEAQGNGYVVASLGEASGYLPYTVYMATDKMLTEKADVVQRFTNAIYMGQIWVNEHDADQIAKVILPQFPDSDLESLTKIIERYKSQDTWTVNPTFNEDGFLLIQDIMKEGGELLSPVPFDKFVVTDFAKKAIEQVN